MTYSTEQNAKSCEVIEQSTKRQHFTDVRHVTVRWEPYKPDGARQMKAKGRWQEQTGTGDYFKWSNCDRPSFAHDPNTEAELIAARKRIAELEAVLALIDKKAPRADATCDEPGITLSEAARRQLGFAK